VLRLGYFMGQDAYGSVLSISRGDHAFPIPDLPVGRLIETATEVAAVLQAFGNTAGVTNGVLTPSTKPLVTGYDFMADGARQVREQFDLAMGATNPTLRSVPVTKDGTTTTYDLIHDPDGAGAPWTADALQKAWFDDRHDLSFIAAHFSDSAALAADGTTIVESSALENAAANMAMTVILGQGCHLGYNLVDPDGVAQVTRTTDWAQAAARKRVGALIAGTGYQFGAGRAEGDTGDIVEYGERLYLFIATQLRSGAVGTPVSIGNAFIEGKRAYLAIVGSHLGSLHEKQVAETTIFGLPMLAVNVPGTRLPAGAVETVTPDANGDVVVGFTGSRALVSNGGFYTGPDGTLGIPGAPILPVDLAIPVSPAPDQVLRGVGFREGEYNDTDSPPFRPSISSPVTEGSASLTDAYRSLVFSPTPNRLATVNYIGALASGTTYLVVTPEQYRSSSADSDTGTARTFTSLTFRLFYRTPGTSVLTQPPAFVDVRAQPTAAGNVLFEAFVVGDSSVAINSVWVTYTDTRSPYPRKWRSIDLTADTSPANPGRWFNEVSLATLGVESIDDVVFMAQAANASGLVGFAANGGGYFRVETPTAVVSAPKRSTTLDITAAPGSGAYRSTATFTAQLNENILGNLVPVAGRTVRFGLGSQRLSALTDADGKATVALKLLQRPGGYKLNAAFDENDANLASANSADFTITQATSTLALSQTSMTVRAGGLWSAAARLTIGAAGDPPTETQTVFFVATGGGRTYVTSTLTATNGFASIPGWDLPVGSYTLKGYFAEIVPLATGTYDARSLYYAGSHTVDGSVIVAAGAVAYTGDMVVPINTQVRLRAAVTAPAGADPSIARVRYVLKRAGFTFASGEVVRGATGDCTPLAASTCWAYTIPAGALAAGVYAVHTSVVGVDYASDGLVSYLSVYDPSGGFATGGGWIDSPAGAFTADPNRTGKATFGFNAKYKKGSNEVTGDTEFQFTAGDLKFKSTSLDAGNLVIAGRKALYRGTGTINDTGSYKFMVSAIDGQENGGVGPDTFRIKITDSVTGGVIYDNLMNTSENADPTTAIGGGSIVVHK
jgi:hypothetical protein